MDHCGQLRTLTPEVARAITRHWREHANTRVNATQLNAQPTKRIRTHAHAHVATLKRCGLKLCSSNNGCPEARIKPRTCKTSFRSMCHGCGADPKHDRNEQHATNCFCSEPAFFWSGDGMGNLVMIVVKLSSHLRLANAILASRKHFPKCSAEENGCGLLRHRNEKAVELG